MAAMPVHLLNLVAPRAPQATAMRSTGTTDHGRVRPGAVALLIGHRLRQCDVNSAIRRSTRPTMPGTRTLTMATRTTTTRTSRVGLVPSADPTAAPYSFEALVAAYLDCRRHKRRSASALVF